MQGRIKAKRLNSRIRGGLGLSSVGMGLAVACVCPKVNAAVVTVDATGTVSYLDTSRGLGNSFDNTALGTTSAIGSSISLSLPYDDASAPYGNYGSWAYYLDYWPGSLTLTSHTDSSTLSFGSDKVEVYVMDNRDLGGGNMVDEITIVAVKDSIKSFGLTFDVPADTFSGLSQGNVVAAIAAFNNPSIPHSGSITVTDNNGVYLTGAIDSISVPEPASIGTAVGGLVLLARRRRTRLN